jgi:hypothetical protein
MDGVEPEFSEASVENAVAWPGVEVQSEAPTAESATPQPEEDSGFWGNGGARDFDWGD